ncbi:hypothetical protein FBULB1_4628 [Fusarium bulbicola]|nr:hypothetical protein FBULB1_4628 [Fusarium bulbicola]
MDSYAEHNSVESTLTELHAYAKLLFLRSGRQFEDRVSYQELEEETSPDEGSSDGNSSKNAPLGNFDTDRLSRKLLDRLSETVSLMKGGRHVVASYMFYWPDKVKIFVAINSGFIEGDALSKFLDDLCTSVKGIAVVPDNKNENHIDALWNMLLRHQSSRLHATIVDLRQIMKGFQHLLPQRPHSKLINDGVLPDIDGFMLDFEGCLKLLAHLLFGDSDSDLERHNSLVTLSHALYRNYPAEKFQALGRQGGNLHREIGFLGRLKTSLHVFVAAARQITGFENLSLIPVVKSKNPEKPSKQEWSLVKTFHALNFQLSDTAVEKLMQPSTSKNKWTKNKLITDFSRLESPTWEVHAEIQLIAFTLGHPDEIANGKRFEYIGCPFCNESCERGMPLSHLLKCTLRQVTSADYLYQDVLDDKTPTDPRVWQDYWFDRCQSSHEESHVLGLFAGLLHYHHYPITREELYQWRSDVGGNAYLVKRIVEKFEELPKSRMGSYFPWFLRHRNRFELPDGHKSIPQRPSPEMQARNMQDEARKYLAPEDQKKDFKDLSPFSKMHCFAFYSIIRASGYPPPVNRNVCHWFDFGFVVCKDQHEEETLCRMYNTMLFGSTSKLEYEESLKSSTPATFMDKKHPACTFDEFWKTWERGDLMAIFNRCWAVFTTKIFFQVSEYDLLSRLRVFFETETPRPSIWKLRHFLAIEDISVESAVPELAQAAEDYGFSETLDTRTTIELKEFYMQLFKRVQPLEVHSERVKGILLQFAERHVGSITLRVKKVLQGLELVNLK